jgi:hypothetical protein
LQAGVLKVGAGYEKFGLGGKWLLHGPSLAKFGRTGNLVVMQRSQVGISSQIEVFQLLSPPKNMILVHITQCRSPRIGRGDLGKLFSYVHESIEDIAEL